MIDAPAINGLSLQWVGERFLQQIDSCTVEDNGEKTSQATKSARDAGPS